ncbi:MAG: hypothetical protein L6Q66_11060 [Bacteroidia bacterium]|nr:hypothetical protein [Bacteroidia bacterium]
MQVHIFILSLFVFLQADPKIEKIKFFLHDSEEDVAVPEKYKPYLTKEQIKEFEHGGAVLTNNICKVYHITFYKWDVDKVVMTFGGYFYTDMAVGMVQEYFASGKISKEMSYALVHNKTKKIISLEKFSGFKNLAKRGTRGYEGLPHGKWKYYSEDGKLVKEEEYDKGVLIKASNY